MQVGPVVGFADPHNLQRGQQRLDAVDAGWAFRLELLQKSGFTILRGPCLSQSSTMSPYLAGRGGKKRGICLYDERMADDECSDVCGDASPAAQ